MTTEISEGFAEILVAVNVCAPGRNGMLPAPIARRGQQTGCDAQMPEAPLRQYRYRASRSKVKAAADSRRSVSAATGVNWE
jgi:hypothetical protein